MSLVYVACPCSTYCVPIASLNQAGTITLSGPHLNNKLHLALLLLIVNHCFLFNQSAFLSQSVVFTSRLSLCVHTYLGNHELFVPKQQTAHFTVFCFCIMAGVFGDYSQLFRLFHASVIKRFVRRENPERELQLKKKKFSDHQR